MATNGSGGPQDKYRRLDEEMEQANHRFIDDTQQQQKVRQLWGLKKKWNSCGDFLDGFCAILK